MEVIFLKTDLTSTEEEHIRSLCLRNKFIKIEDNFTKIITIVNDTLQVVYIVEKELYRQRMDIVDIPSNTLEFNKILRTRITKNILSNGECFYTLGNLFAYDSVILGPKFSKFMETDKFKDMIGTRKNLFIATDKTGNFTMENVHCDQIGPEFKLGGSTVTPMRFSVDEIIRLLRVESKAHK